MNAAAFATQDMILITGMVYTIVLVFHLLVGQGRQKEEMRRLEELVRSLRRERK